MIGLVFIYSSSSVYALEKCGSAHYFVKKQLLGCILGIVGLIICRFLPIAFIKRASPFVFGWVLILTMLTLVPSLGATLNGSKRWLIFFGVGFQPSEALKMALILYIAYLLAKKQYRLGSFWHSYVPLWCILGSACLVLLLQPDFGQAITLCITAFLLFFIAECRMSHLALTLAATIPTALLLVLLKPYRFKRIITFLNPWQDPKGAGFQIIQSLIAIGSGNVWGVGIARSKQKFFYLPMQCTDFIFSIIAEETGFLGASALILLYLGFLYIGIKIARSLQDLFSFYVVLGFVLLISLQAIINLFVATGLMPTKGLGLPFVSYGNSALLCNLCMLGIVINCFYADKEI